MDGVKEADLAFLLHRNNTTRNAGRQLPGLEESIEEYWCSLERRKITWRPGTSRLSNGNGTGFEKQKN